MNFLVLVAILLLSLYFYKRLTRKKLNLPPGPRGWPIVGNAFQVSQKLYDTYGKWKEEFGNIYHMTMLSTKAVILSDVKLIKECYNEVRFSGRSDRILTSVLAEGSNGVVLSQGQKWVEQRRFTLRHLRDFGFGKNYMESLVMEEVQDMMQEFKEQEGKSIHMNEKFALAVVNSLWMIVAGKKFKQDDAENLNILEEMHDTFTKLSTTSLLHVIAPSLLKIFPGPLGYTNVLNVASRTKKMLREVIREHEESLPEDGNPRDFIDAFLLEIKNTADTTSSFYKEEGHKQLVAGIGDLFFAGSDTTSTSLSWTILYLASHPEVQKKLQKELDLVVGKSRQVSLSDKPNLPYTEAVILEILRQSSITVMGVFHTALEDTTFHGYDIPKGSWLMANQYIIHHDKGIWGDPENFRPERFLSSDGKTVIKNENLIPFSVGKRVCIGETLARDTIFLFLTNIFQRFSIDLDKSKPVPNIDESATGVIRKPLDYFVIMKDRAELAD